MSVATCERLFTLAGLVVECIALDGDRVRALARSSAAAASCTYCGRASRRVHSRYVRRLADLPACRRVGAIRSRSGRASGLIPTFGTLGFWRR